MALIKEESEDTVEQAELMVLKEESEVLLEMEEQDHSEKKQWDFISGEKPRETEKTRSNGHLNCDLCGKRFTHKGSLKIHMRVHTGEKPYTCPQCGKGFTHKGSLNDHRRVHTGEKPYSCQQCGKHFTQKQNLTVHQRVHTGEKPYTCPQCGQSFRHKKDLYTHISRHTDTAFTCKLCRKSFSHEEIDNAHIEMDRGESAVTCQHMCGHISPHENPYRLPMCPENVSVLENVKCPLVENCLGKLHKKCFPLAENEEFITP